MSHLVQIAVQFNDPDAIEAACKELGFIFNRGDTKCTSPYFTEACEHTISIPGVEECNIGLFRTADRKSLQLGYDSMYRHITQALSGGKNQKAERFTQCYAVAKATIEARRRGWTVQKQTAPNGSIKLVCTGM